uniref:Uncharacterized protein n=1 Tax=Monopterus albus TaxID=43700 RepID=A0A3Q3QWN3_MONAL
ISITITVISDVPERTGSPPSTAVRIRLCTGSFSRSRGFSRTSSGIFLPSLTKLSLGFSV